MLIVEGLDAGYGEAQILFGVDLSIGEGEVVTLLGRNGMGKTTTIRAIMGLIPPKSGRVSFAGAISPARPPSGSPRRASASCPRGA
jgi:branched-chain amino acid transport system ATP-binding protein